MAFLPCDRGHPNPRGRNQLVYSAYGSSGTDFTRFRLRLCQLHAAIVYQHLAQFEIDADTGSVLNEGAADLCIACLKPMGETGWQVFATCYPTQNERKDYWAKLHSNCRFPEYLLNTGDNGYIPREPGDEPRPTLP